MSEPVDVYVGERLRIARKYLGLSQEQLANMSGVTFQQVQKYEKGVNRISASRLYILAKALNVEIGFFFEGYKCVDIESPADDRQKQTKTPLEKMKEHELMMHYNNIKDPQLKDKILEIASIIALDAIP